MIKAAPIPKVQKEELIGFSNYNKLATDFVQKKRLVNERSPHEKVLKNKASIELKIIKKESKKVVNEILD